MVTKQDAWGRDNEGNESTLYTIQNSLLTAQVTDQGAALTAFICPDRDGKTSNVVAGGNSPDVYFDNPSYLGATVGRYANRIGNGRFWLDGKEIVLPRNLGSSHLHGGFRGLTRRRWDAEVNDDSVTFSTVSPDGEDGYPGKLEVSVTYRLENHILKIEYTARTDSPTVVNLTNHAYWNLNGSETIFDHQFECFSDAYLEVDKNIIPTGTILDVAGSRFDFRTRTRLGDVINQTGEGYDHCFVIRDWDSSLRHAATMSAPSCGRVMEVHTTTPGVQFYTANHFNGSPECANRNRYGAFCLECQHFPDSPNQLEFPSTALRPGEEYRQTTEHRFFTAR